MDRIAIMKKKRASIVSYLNSLPPAWGFMHGPQHAVFDLDFSVPSACADLLARGEAEIGLVPVIEYQRISGLKVVPGISLASKQQVKSVLMLSKIPAEQIRTLAADISSRTSVCLVEILLHEKYGVRPKVVPHLPDVPAMLKQCDACLVIGDVALKCRKEGLLVYDLASAWRSLTGRPFVFAVWAVRGDLTSVEKEAFAGSYQFGRDNLAQIVSDQTAKLGLDPELIATYLTENMNYALDDENLQGLQLFFDLALKHKMIEAARPIEFV